MKLVLLLFLLSCKYLAVAQDTTCGIAWGPMINISLPPHESYSPRIAVQGEIIHSTWIGGGHRLSYARSTDAGISWEESRELLVDSIAFPVLVNDPWVIANETHVYLIFTFSLFTGRAHYMKSFDGGVNWTYPAPINDELNTQRIWHATLTGDTIFIAYPRHGPRIIRSTNGGATWDTSLAVVRFPVEFAGGRLHNVLEFGIQSRWEIAYRHSTDLGDSWADSVLLSTPDQLDSDQRVLGVVGGDSASAGVFVMWRDAKYGFGTLVGESILMRHSPDNGSTWLPETLMTEPGAPVGYNNSFTGQQISSSGNTVAACWTDDLAGHINLRYSINGGDTWSPLCDVTPGRIALNPSCVIQGSVIHVVWNDRLPTHWSIHYRRGVIVSTSAEEKTNESIGFKLEQNYPNPFNPRTKISFAVPQSLIVTLKVYDVLGREVATLVNERKEMGEHSVGWNAEGVASGLYMYRLVAIDHANNVLSQAKAMILIK